MTRAETIQGSQTLTGINQDTQEARQSFGGFDMNRGLGMFCLQRRKELCVKFSDGGTDGFILRRVSSTRHASS